MKKKVAIALTSLLILTVLLTTPYIAPPTVAPDGTGNHWKIMLAQENTNAWIIGYLTNSSLPPKPNKIVGTDFFLNCTCELPPPQPIGQFGFWKVWTPPGQYPADIHYTKFIDWNKDGTPDEIIDIDHPIPYDPEPPNTVYQHVETGPGPFGPWMVVVEVREQPYDIKDPYFEWQLTMKTTNINVTWTGFLTLNDAKLTGTDFTVICKGRADTPVIMNCTVVETDWCTVPNDIESNLATDDITQFPWTKEWEPIPGTKIELELTEVQSYNYPVISGMIASNGWLRRWSPWYVESPFPPGSVPFASREPWVTPMIMGQTITFTQRDPITGIVKLSVLAASYKGLNHTYYSGRVGTFFNVQVILEMQGCGWLWTGKGKKPAYGCVDREVYNNWQGVYNYGADGVYDNGTVDDELLAAKVVNVDDPAGPGPYMHAGGAGFPIGPCLQELRGPDGIPCTLDDPLGRSDPDGPDTEPGHSILFLPTRMIVDRWNIDVEPPVWTRLFSSPWPQLLTTGWAYDKVIEPRAVYQNPNPPPAYYYLDGEELNSSDTFFGVKQGGKPWEFYAGLDHPGSKVDWKHENCNVYVTYVCTWSVMSVDTDLCPLDVHFIMVLKLMREDCGIPGKGVLPDIKDDDEEIKIGDVRRAARAYDTKDERFGYWMADDLFDGGADVLAETGYVGIADVRRIALYYGLKLTPSGLQSA